MKTKIIEASNGFNWGKFLVGQFDSEWERRPALEETKLPLLTAVGWTEQHRVVLDLQTGEGGIFFAVPSGYPTADLEKHKVWVCPLFEPFLGWLYQQDLSDVERLPSNVLLPDAPSALSGYRRSGT